MSDLYQDVLWRLLEKYRVPGRVGSVQIYDLIRLLGPSADLLVGFFDPFLVTHAGWFLDRAELARREAIGMHIRRPFVVHLAFVTQKRKLEVMTEIDLIFWKDDPCQRFSVVAEFRRSMT